MILIAHAGEQNSAGQQKLLVFVYGELVTEFWANKERGLVSCMRQAVEAVRLAQEADAAKIQALAALINEPTRH